MKIVAGLDFKELKISGKRINTLERMADVVMKHGGGFRIQGDRFYLYDSWSIDGAERININGREYTRIDSFAQLFQGLGY